MAVISESVQFTRLLPSGGSSRAGNRVQLEDGDGNVMGTEENPIFVGGDLSGGGPSQVQILDEDGNEVGETRPLRVSPSVKQTSATPTIDATPDYSAGDVVAAIPLINVPSVAGRPVRLATIHIIDRAGQSPALLLFIIPGTLVGSYTGNSPIVWHASDAGGVAVVVDVSAANYKVAGGAAMQTILGINVPLFPAASTVSVIVVANGTYNAAAATDLKFLFTWEQL